MAIHLIESQKRLLFAAQVSSFAMKDRSSAKLEVKASSDLASATHIHCLDQISMVFGHFT